jgi:hypothetical protein
MWVGCAYIYLRNELFKKLSLDQLHPDPLQVSIGQHVQMLRFLDTQLGDASVKGL